MARRSREDRFDLAEAKRRLEELWTSVSAEGERDAGLNYLTDAHMREAIADSINHPQVGYRFCLPVQLMGKLINSKLDALCLQRGADAADSRSWDARSLASRVIAPFNLAQEAVLGPSNDPYVGNAFRIPRMRRDDASKKDPVGWNVLIDVLQEVERRNDSSFTEAVFKQVLLEMHRRQRNLRFSYPVPPRISINDAISLARRFIAQPSGGDRPLAVAGALFDVIGQRFGIYKRVERARINASDQASGQAADLECLNAEGCVVLAVEVKDRALMLADVDATIVKARHRSISEIIFTALLGSEADEQEVQQRFESAFASGQSLYRIDLLDLASAVLAVAGAEARVDFVRGIGNHLDRWTTQPSHRQAWKLLLETH